MKLTSEALARCREQSGLLRKHVIIDYFVIAVTILLLVFTHSIVIDILLTIFDVVVVTVTEVLSQRNKCG